MKKYKKKRIEVVDDIICNQCGLSLKKEYNLDGISVEMICGYGSEEDGVGYYFDLCRNCVKELIKGFKIAAERKEYQ